MGPSAEATGSAGAKGWYLPDAIVDINARDADNVREIHCSINDVETVVAGSNVSTPLTSDVTYTITYMTGAKFVPPLVQSC